MNDSIKIIGKVHNLKQTDKSVFCGINIYNSKAKVGAFLNAAFIKEAFEPATRLENKDKVEIVSGFITADVWKKGDMDTPILKLIVFGFKNLTNPEADSEEGGFHESNEEEDDLPF